jgi:hypothetical protein
MRISRFPIRPGVDLRNINSASPRGPFFFNRQRRAVISATMLNSVICNMAGLLTGKRTV